MWLLLRTKQFKKPTYNANYQEDHGQNLYGNDAGERYENQRNRYYDMVTNVFHEAVISDNSRQAWA